MGAHTGWLLSFWVWIQCWQKNLEKRLEEKWKKSSKLKHYSKKLLQNFKSLGVCTQLLKNSRRELPYYCHIHKANKIARPDLLKLDGYFSSKKLSSSVISFSDDCTSCQTVVDLPINKNAIAIMDRAFKIKFKFVLLCSKWWYRICLAHLLCKKYICSLLFCWLPTLGHQGFSQQMEILNTE